MSYTQLKFKKLKGYLQQIFHNSPENDRPCAAS